VNAGTPEEFTKTSRWRPLFRTILKTIGITFLIIGVIGIIIFVDDGAYNTVTTSIKDFVVQVQVKSPAVGLLYWPLMFVLAGIFLAFISRYLASPSRSWWVRSRRRLVIKRMRHRRRGFFDRVFGAFGRALSFVGSIWSVFWGFVFGFFHITLVLGGNVAVLLVIYALMIQYPEPLQRAWPVLLGSDVPRQLQDSVGYATVFISVAIALTVAFFVFMMSAKSFGWLLSSYASIDTNSAGVVIAYLLYGTSFTIAVGLFNKAWAIWCIIVTFILVPIVVGLVTLLFEETKQEK
jgi:hypothetical protein